MRIRTTARRVAGGLQSSRPTDRKSGGGASYLVAISPFYCRPFHIRHLLSNSTYFYSAFSLPIRRNLLPHARRMSSVEFGLNTWRHSLVVVCVRDVIKTTCSSEHRSSISRPFAFDSLVVVSGGGGGWEGDDVGESRDVELTSLGGRVIMWPMRLLRSISLLRFFRRFLNKWLPSLSSYFGSIVKNSFFSVRAFEDISAWRKGIIYEWGAIV